MFGTPSSSPAFGAATPSFTPAFGSNLFSTPQSASSLFPPQQQQQQQQTPFGIQTPAAAAQPSPFTSPSPFLYAPPPSHPQQLTTQMAPVAPLPFSLADRDIQV